MSEHPVRRLRLRATFLLCTAAALPARAGTELPDPLRPPALSAPHAPQPASAPVAPALRLQATRVGADGRYAIIDGRPVRRGERIGDAVVVRIDAAAVTLRDDQAERVLRFDAPGLSKRPADGHGQQP